MGINSDNRQGAPPAIFQAAEQSPRCLPGKRRIRRQHDDDVSGFGQRSTYSGDHCGGRSTAGRILSGEDHRKVNVAHRADDHYLKILRQRSERTIQQRLALHQLGQFVGRKAL